MTGPTFEGVLPLEILKKLLKPIRNTIHLTVLNFLSMGLNLIGFILIANLLGPKDYGTYTLVGTFVGFFRFITLSGYSKILIREGIKNPKGEQKVFEEVIGIKMVSITVSIITCIVAAFFFPYSMLIKFYIIIASSQLIYLGLADVFNSIFIIREEMKFIAIFPLIRDFIRVIVSITLLLLGFDLLAVFITIIFSQLISLVMEYYYSRKYMVFKIFSKVFFNRNYFRSAVTFSLMAFVFNLSTKIDILMIPMLGTISEVGIYSIPMLITDVGLGIRDIIATSFFPMMIRSSLKKVDKKRILKLSIVLFMVITVFAVIISLASNLIVDTFFRDEYRYSGKILSVLIFYLAFSFFTIPFGNYLQAANKEYILLIGGVFTAISNIGLNILFYDLFGLIGIAYSTVLTFGLGTVLILLAFFKTIK